MKELERSTVRIEKLFTTQTSPGLSTILARRKTLVKYNSLPKDNGLMRPNPKCYKALLSAETEQPELNVFTVKHGGGSIVFKVTLASLINPVPVSFTDSYPIFFTFC